MPNHRDDPVLTPDERRRRFAAILAKSASPAGSFEARHSRESFADEVPCWFASNPHSVSYSYSLIAGRRASATRRPAKLDNSGSAVFVLLARITSVSRSFEMICSAVCRFFANA